VQNVARSAFRFIATLPVVALLLTVTLLPHRALAQIDPGAQAAQDAIQATQQAAQAAQQANQQAMDAAQQANSQAMQDANTAPVYSSSAPQYPVAPMDPNTPVPSQIRSAHTIFFTNAGADPNFPIDSTQVYNEVYAALQQWGHYQLVSAPAQAELIFRLRNVVTTTNVTGAHGSVTPIVSPGFRLTIVDTRTMVPLWTVTSPILLKGRGDTLAHWENLSITNLVSRLKVLAGQPLSDAETADLTTYPNYHFARTALIVGGSFVAAGAVGGIILHHEFENSLANQKSSQDAFCEANHIPLSECAGG
jgi:type II secretory pathway pseudopilin PulG